MQQCVVITCLFQYLDASCSEAHATYCNCMQLAVTLDSSPPGCTQHAFALINTVKLDEARTDTGLRNNGE